MTTYFEDKEVIDKLVKEFFNLFCNDNEKVVNLNNIYNIFIPNGMVIKNIDNNLEIYNLPQFILPRQEMFENKTLVEFSEKEIFEKTDIFGNIAQRFCIYEKSGYINEKYIHCKGMKSFQFIRTSKGWKISCSAWDDESENVKVNSAYISKNTI